MGVCTVVVVVKCIHKSLRKFSLGSVSTIKAAFSFQSCAGGRHVIVMYKCYVKFFSEILQECEKSNY